MSLTKEESKKQLGEATEKDLLFNILISHGRFVDGGSDENFIAEQSQDFACTAELKRRGLSAEQISQKVEQFKKEVLAEAKSGKRKMPEELWFL